MKLPSFLSSLAGVAALVLTLAGCIGGPSLVTAYITQLNTSLSASLRVTGATVNYCYSTGTFDLRTFCQYAIGDALTAVEVNYENSSEVVALLDPVILQVPAAATDFGGTYSGPGGSGNLAIVDAGASIAADFTRRITAEPGMKLVVIDFPAPPAANKAYDFTFQFSVPDGVAPIPVKLLMTGKVVVNGQTYYMPLVPCETDFAKIPQFQLTLSNQYTPVSLAPLSKVPGCQGTRYQFTPGTATTVDVVEYYNATLDHYFITWVAAEQANLDAGNTPTRWTRTGSTFKAYTTAQAGTSPVCRYYIPPAKGDSHFFGRGTTECNATGVANPTFVLEDAQFMQLFLPAAGTCASGTIPIYRVFSNRPDANHRYMTDRAIRTTMVGQGWLAEGDGPDLVVMCAPQ